VHDFDSVDFFSDPSLIPDPHPYFDHLRRACPVRREPHYGVFAVTGYHEATQVLKDTGTFSSCISIGGPFPPLPFVPDGDDIGAQIDRNRHLMPMFEHMVTMDPPAHTYARSLLSRLLTPSRLKENEEFMWTLADRQLDEFLDTGQCEFLAEYAKPFSLMVIADLLGVPESDHDAFRAALGAQAKRFATLDNEATASNPLQWLDDTFGAYIADRRRAPRDDVLTALGTATYPDGSTPEVTDVVRTATFLFAAGQETTAKLLGAALRVIGDRPDLQRSLRADPSRIPTFIEEALRMEAPVKSDFRLTRKSTTVGGVDLPAGTIVMVCPGAANRDPLRFDHPHAFDTDRRNVREHISFGRGVHSCPGAPLARVEGRVSLERILHRMLDIRIDPEQHGPPGERHYTYEPTFLMRGLTELHLRFTPVG
jgi:cytochrome P450